MFLICQRDAPRLPNDKYSARFCNFIEKCMNKDPNKRLTASQLLQHEFLLQTNGK